jgi:hypothetical protein
MLPPVHSIMLYNKGRYDVYLLYYSLETVCDVTSDITASYENDTQRSYRQ